MVQRAVLAVQAGLVRSVVCVFADAPILPGGTSGSTYARSGGVEGTRGLERARCWALFPPSPSSPLGT